MLKRYLERVAVILSLVSHTGYPVGAQSVPTNKEAAPLVEQAAQAANLTTTGSPPFHLVAQVQYELGGESAEGNYELRQAAPTPSGDERQLYDRSIIEPDIQARITLLQQFLAQYPASALKEGALEKLVTSYQQAGNGLKVIETNNALLKLNPNNLQAIALVVNVRLRAAAKGMDAQENYKIAGKVAERGLRALEAADRQSENAVDDTKEMVNYRALFESAIGKAALDVSDYASARQHLLRAVQLQPDEIQDSYLLGPAYLDDSANRDPSPGFWYLARAAALSKSTEGQTHIPEIARDRYIWFHGTQDGWNELCVQAKDSITPASNFEVHPLPSSCGVLFAVSRLSDDGKLMTTQLSGLSNEQDRWWHENGQKLFPNFCLVDQLVADYALLWKSKKETVIDSSQGAFVFGTYLPDKRIAMKAWVFAHRISPTYHELLQCERGPSSERSGCGMRKIISPALFEVDDDEVRHPDAGTGALQEALAKLQKQPKHN
jgi:tetratricopeptide (TPR) repeat protein